ncbi:MAG: hypothetical protein ACYTGN_06185 [Planctomycetota bacterium]
MDALDEFAAVTRRVFASEGLGTHIPTACFPGRNHLAALAEIPPDVDLERASVEWAAALAQGDEDFLVVFKVDPGRFKIVARLDGSYESRTYSIDG